MDYYEWKSTYTPKMRSGSEENGFLFGLSEADLNYLKTLDNTLIWTEFDDGSEIYIENGFIESETDGSLTGYLVTEVPWSAGSEHRIFIGEYHGCGCLSEEDLEPDQDCQICYGEGYRLEWLTGDFPLITP